MKIFKAPEGSYYIDKRDTEEERSKYRIYEVIVESDDEMENYELIKIED